jgi:methionine-rich copper-binding protein CopC
MRSGLSRRLGIAVLGLGFLVAASPAAFAHAILVEAKPAAKSTVAGPDVAVALRFNSRIDSARSHLSLVAPGDKESALAVDVQSAPNLLTAKAAGLAPGAYRLRWQVLAADGHITRGEVPFQVK